MSEGPRVLVTGAGRGTGYAIARAFHERGWSVASLNRTPRGEGWLGELECDVADREAVRAAVPRAIEALGGLDVLVANAAVRRLGRIGELSDADWDASVATNLSGVFAVVGAALPALVRSRGCVVVLGSQAGAECFEGGAAYCATKAALKALVEVLLLERRHDGVRATLVVPGAIANRDGDGSAHKLDPARVAEVVVRVATLPADCVVREVAVDPTAPLRPPYAGIERLQYA
jgi:3-oxoacyl-[acyl-carrier protein] reductase